MKELFIKVGSLRKPQLVVQYSWANSGEVLLLQSWRVKKREQLGTRWQGGLCGDGAVVEAKDFIVGIGQPMAIPQHREEAKGNTSFPVITYLCSPWLNTIETVCTESHGAQSRRRRVQSISGGANLCPTKSDSISGLPFLPCTQLVQGESDFWSETEQEATLI